VAIVVDEIGDVLQLPEARWEPPPDTLSKEHRRFVSRICPIDGDVVLGLDLQVLGIDEDREVDGQRETANAREPVVAP
jgi:chemotaxis signal transduction protein